MATGELESGYYGADALAVGDWINCGSVTVTAEMIDRFASLTGDRFEIHMSDDAAQRHGFAARVAHGLLVLSLIDGLKNRAAAQLKARASRSWQWTFHAPVLAGDVLFARLVIAAIDPARHSEQANLSLAIEVSNAHGVKVQSGTNVLLAYR